MGLRHSGGANYKPRTKTFTELMDMVREIVGKARLLNKELAKFTELDMQKAVESSSVKVNRKSLNLASNDILILEELLEDGGVFGENGDCEKLSTQLGKLRFTVSAEHDARFLGKDI